jgi:hypothetical protein
MESQANRGAMTGQVCDRHVGKQAPFEAAEVGRGRPGDARDFRPQQPAGQTRLAQIEAKLLLKPTTDHRGLVDLALPVGHEPMIGHAVLAAA